jgi:hypothetical protein
MTTIQRESFWDALEGVKSLINAHWEEVALHRGEIQLNPDFSRYQVADSQGRLVIITAREDGVMVGYSVFILGHHIHYRECLVASNDVIYVKPEKRGIVGARLIKRSEEILEKLKVKKIAWHVKPKNDWSGVLSRMGYTQEEIIMAKLLGDSNGI